MAEGFNEYVAGLGASLRAKCGAAKSETILSEALSHLEEGIQELVGSGQIREEAERVVMARFGDVGSVCAWYAEQHGSPSVWRASRWPLVALACFGFAWHFQYQLFSELLVVGISTVIPLYLLFAVLIFACFRSKRLTSQVMMVASAVFCAVFFGALCCFGTLLKGQYGYGVIAKWSVGDTVKETQQRLSLYERQLAMLQVGAKAFAPLHEPRAGVGQFHDSRGYLSPIYVQTLDPKVQVFFDDKRVNGIFSSYKEARGYWIDQPWRVNTFTGKRQIYYLTDAKEQVEDARRIIRDLTPVAQGLPSAQTISFAEKAPEFGKIVLLESGFIYCVGLAADLLGGCLRLLVAYLRRVKRVTPLVS